MPQTAIRSRHPHGRGSPPAGAPGARQDPGDGRELPEKSRCRDALGRKLRNMRSSCVGNRLRCDKPSASLSNERHRLGRRKHAVWRWQGIGLPCGSLGNPGLSPLLVIHGLAVGSGMAPAGGSLAAAELVLYGLDLIRFGDSPSRPPPRTIAWGRQCRPFSKQVCRPGVLVGHRSAAWCAAQLPPCSFPGWVRALRPATLPDPTCWSPCAGAGPLNGDGCSGL